MLVRAPSRSGYTFGMSTETLAKQLEPVVSERENMVRLRVGKRTVVVLSDPFYRRVKPLLDYMANRPDMRRSRAGADWNESKNARRMHLIDKKYDRSLTAAEKKE